MSDKWLSEMLVGWLNRYFHAWGRPFHVTFMECLHVPSTVGATASKVPWAVPAMAWDLGEEIESGNKNYGSV